MAEIVLELTAFQAAEVTNGLDIDAADGKPEWGELRRAGKRPGTLVIADSQEARDAALYRLTSIRDIWGDNSADPFASNGVRAGCASRARSMAGLVRQLIKAAGGWEAFSPDVRRWADY